jgi:hypothetical protein
VDKEKIEVIEQLPPPTNVKGIRSFLGHAGLYQRIIQNFSQIAHPSLIFRPKMSHSSSQKGVFRHSTH